MPKMSDKYNILEIPRSCIDGSGESFLKEGGHLGENDKKKLAAFNNNISGGYKIHSFGMTNSNTYLFLFEKK